MSIRLLRVNVALDAGCITCTAPSFVDSLILGEANPSIISLLARQLRWQVRVIGEYELITPCAISSATGPPRAGPWARILPIRR
jgi:hypothetical protein